MEFFNENTRDFLSGVVIPVNKPAGWTSFDVVNKIRLLLKYERGYKKIKVGHAGTLDPAATGLLLVCTGKATKQISTLQSETKTYEARIKFGETTPSFDSETEADANYPTEHITREGLDSVLKQFIGETEQIPPVYSAVHINGKRAYEMARKGEKPEMKARQIIIDDIKVKTFELPFADITVECHAGTYIRALVRDIGVAMNSGAWMFSLIRTKSGDFSLDDAFTMEKIEKILKN